MLQIITQHTVLFCTFLDINLTGLFWLQRFIMD